MCREGEYGMVRADLGRENFWAGSNNAGVLKITAKMVGRYRGRVDVVRRV